MRSLVIIFSLCALCFAEEDWFKVIPDSRGNQYFDDGKASYYTRYLRAMDEPSIREMKVVKDEAILRFTYLRSFDDPVVVRLHHKDGKITLFCKVMTMTHEYELTELTRNQRREIKGDRWRRVYEASTVEGFWQPLTDTEKYLEGLDGSTWVFEIIDSDGYRMIDPWSPQLEKIPEGITMTRVKEVVERHGLKFTPIRDFSIYSKLGIELLNLAGIKPLPLY